jgi:8-amino-7-oxononanoate synthase
VQGLRALEQKPVGRRSVFAAQAEDLTRLDSIARFRQLSPRAGLDFASNDYLGLAQSSVVAEAVTAALARGVPIGSGGSRLLRGNHEEHEALEREAAAFLGSESALFFSSGYAANSALIATLPQRRDLIIHDESIHASVHEGLRLTRAAHVSARHNDPNHVEDLCRRWRRQEGSGALWIAVESLYSMDGDLAPLGELAAIADRYDAILVIDEAHATGVFGSQGKGLAAGLRGRDNIITLHTCGKALGCEGALICSPAIVRDFLINRGRGFIFSTAPSPLMAAAVRASLKLVAAGEALREALRGNVRASQCCAKALGLDGSASHIVPVLVGDAARTVELATQLQSAGFDVRAIRPPTVPEYTSRLRISITNNVSEADIHALFGAIAVLL